MNERLLLMSAKDFLEMVKREIKNNYPTHKVFAESNGLSQTYVSDVLLGRREPGEKFLKAVNAKRVVFYEVFK